MKKSIALLDYGSGNLRSAERALRHVAAEVVVTSDAKVAQEADALVVPGVGAYAACMQQLRAIGADASIISRVEAGRPTLGICVGMQILFESGIEHGLESNGLGIWPGQVQALSAETLPHMGWNSVEPDSRSILFQGVENEQFYFVHSYAATSGPESAVETMCRYEDALFLAACESGPLAATQFHPEKSGEAGLHLLSNWVRSL